MELTRIEEFRVKPTRILFMGVAITTAMLLASLQPAVAASSADSLIYFAVPGGLGGTYSCTSGPPFVSELGSTQENCTLYQVGAPTGLVCDIPTTVTFVPTLPEVPEVVSEYLADGWLCH